ncbi:threonine aldolase family protein [Capillimicrobium parvum]|uniref:Low specificity L-threonine aldolase n=1 Tax=Capillimicrobium parvum TaxID=2884022 RepID=A0A9E6XZZ2_9ACTN|nr:beta-eliminating lyase-related protein [Capillimicrobium parvum]UGS36891.1 Low specificity L-threonine aldolase [Capillimicrobium parvum]
MKSFASDNYAAVHPAVLEAIGAANQDHARAYGADPWTARAEALLRDAFGADARSFAVFNGTGANVLSIRAACRSAAAVICTDTAHINVDEGGAPERIAGVKLLTAPAADGKLTPADVERLCVRMGDEHQAQPGLVSISQTTELGTRYDPAEIAALAAAAHERGLLLHVDGARICHAAAALDCSLAAITTDAGVDLVSFGATKVGALGAEAVVVLRPELADALPYLRKQSLQLASKGRFLAAQLAALLEGELWRELAGHANAMAARLAGAVAGIDGVTVTQAVQANAVFAILPEAATREVQEQWPFYVWDPATGEVRWMCAWDTTPDEVDGFAEAIRTAVGARV